MLTTNQVEEALSRSQPQLTYATTVLDQVARNANAELEAWGHTNHQITTERVAPYFGDPGLLLWTFWCETCHVSQFALLSRPLDEQP